MKRLTKLTVLIGALIAPALYAEEPVTNNTAPLSFPLPKPENVITGLDHIGIPASQFPLQTETPAAAATSDDTHTVNDVSTSMEQIPAPESVPAQPYVAPANPEAAGETSAPEAPDPATAASADTQDLTDPTLLTQQALATPTDGAMTDPVPATPDGIPLESTQTDMLPPPLPPITEAVEPESAATEVSSLSLAQMGMSQGIMLSGSQLQGGANFTLAGDQVITTVQLMLDVRVSPEMAKRNASLQMMMNGQPLGSVPLIASETNVSHFQLDVPAALMVSSNNLSFRINEKNQEQCFRGASPGFQVTILPDSHFTFEGQQLSIAADLSHFPRPFFDPMQMMPASVAFSFPSKVTADTVSAAAMISSWLGIQADYRGVSFEALQDILPENDGIVIGHPGERIGGLTLPQTDKPLLSIIDNPANPVYKLLLIVGKDDAALRAAAWRLTRGHFNVQTAKYEVGTQAIPLSRPYDAPRWIPTGRRVKISELLRADQSLTVNGVWHSALQVAFRAAPDLYLWDGDTIPLKIGYRFPSETWINERASQLSVTLNDNFLHNLPMNKKGLLESLWHKLGSDARQEQFTIPLEPYMIYGDNQLSLYFNVVPKKSAPCSVLLNNNIKSRIADDSWIDLRTTRHFTLLPNLSYFVGASFPFTRLADYSQTLLLLPKKPTATEISTLLNMSARSGNATGAALANNRVMLGMPSDKAQRDALSQRDVLAVTSLEQKDFNKGLLAGSPYSERDNTLSVSSPTLWQKAQRWSSGDWSTDSIDADRYFSSNSAWRGFVSYRSPWNKERLVIVALGSDDQQLSQLHSDLNTKKINAGIRGDTAIITTENGVRSFSVGMQFPSGKMSWYKRVVWYANQHSVLLAILGILAATLIGLALTAMLKRHAHKRLNPRDGK